MHINIGSENNITLVDQLETNSSKGKKRKRIRSEEEKKKDAERKRNLSEEDKEKKMQGSARLLKV